MSPDQVTSAPRNAAPDEAQSRHLPGVETVRTRVSGVGDNSVILDKVTDRRGRGKYDSISEFPLEISPPQ